MDRPTHARGDVRIEAVSREQRVRALALRTRVGKALQRASVALEEAARGLLVGHKAVLFGAIVAILNDFVDHGSIDPLLTKLRPQRTFPARAGAIP